MSELTPTTGTVKRAYVSGLAMPDGASEGFDRWLETYEDRIRASERAAIAGRIRLSARSIGQLTPDAVARSCGLYDAADIAERAS